MDNISLEKERYVLDADGVEILSIPQCADCTHNQGMMKCAALASKPMEYMMNTEDCPMKEPGE